MNLSYQLFGFYLVTAYASVTRANSSAFELA